MFRVLSRVVVILIVVCGYFGYRWYSYVSNDKSPFDEVGIELNSYMPGPLNAWGCTKLKETFGNKTLPPAGCQDGTGTGWR